MSSPNFDELNVRLSRIIEDPVAAATTDGDAFTSAFRSHCINQGIRRLLRVWAVNGPEDAIREYLNTEAQTLASSVKALSSWTGGVYLIKSAYNATDAIIVNPMRAGLQDEVLNGVNQYLLASTTQQYYTLNAGNFYLHGGTATSSVRLTYVKQHTDLTAGGAAGTVVSDTAWTASTTTITNFTGVLSTHVGGKFVGLDSGGNPFERTIATYVSSTSFTINSALVADGAGTNGYIVPPSANDIIIPSQYWNDVLDAAAMYFWEQYPSQENTVKLGMKRGS